MKTIRKPDPHIPHIRWMIRHDMPEVLDIEQRSFANPWSEDEFTRFLREAAVVGMIAEVHHRVVALMIYKLGKLSLAIHNFAVHPDYRRMKIGTAMIDELKGKLSQGRRYKLICPVADYNLLMHVFLKAHGFTCDRILPEHFPDPDSLYDTDYVDAYEFVYRPPVTTETQTGGYVAKRRD